MTDTDIKHGEQMRPPVRHDEPKAMFSMRYLTFIEGTRKYVNCVVWSKILSNTETYTMRRKMDKQNERNKDNAVVTVSTHSHLSGMRCRVWSSFLDIERRQKERLMLSRESNLRPSPLWLAFCPWGHFAYRITLYYLNVLQLKLSRSSSWIVNLFELLILKKGRAFLLSCLSGSFRFHGV